MMHRISTHLSDINCYFTPFYADKLAGKLAASGMLDFTILGGRHRAATESYLKQNALPVDFGGKSRDYDMVVTCTDLLVPTNVLGNRMVLVQEGITEPEIWTYHLVKKLKLPRYLANTAATGLSDAYDVFCVASSGYRDLFIRKGIRPHKIAVTGIPNFDHMHTFLDNEFPYHGYILVATSPLRESFRVDDRKAFISDACRIAAGGQIIFYLHPNENHRRAKEEICRYAPGALIFTDGNVDNMIANCQVLITQTSTVTFIGLALGKEVYSYLDLQELRKLLPIQNGGSSAGKITHICEKLLQTPLKELKANPGHSHSHPGWAEADAV
jgi:hypothetical protein